MLKRRPVPAVLVSVACALVLMGGTLGWMLHRSFGKEPALVSARASTSTEARVLESLRRMVESGNTRMAVPESDGRRLRLLAEAIDAKNVVEVGTSTGYSALWLSLACAALMDMSRHSRSTSALRKPRGRISAEPAWTAISR